MALHTREEFEGAVEALLCPRHYEYLLFIQRKLEDETDLTELTKVRRARTVIRMVQKESPSLPTLNVREAMDVLEEAVHRLE